MTETDSLRVLIADDEPLAAERLQLLLARAEGAQLVGRLNLRHDEPVQARPGHGPQVVGPQRRPEVVDAHPPLGPGFTRAQHLCAEVPRPVLGCGGDGVL